MLKGRIAIVTGGLQAEEIAIMGASNPQNRLIQPEEIAALTAFCCSNAAAGLTMEDIQVNASTKVFQIHSPLFSTE